MNFSPKRKTVTFVVRIWAEYLSEQPPRWCGVIEPVEKREMLYFKDLSQIPEIIQENTQSPIPNFNEKKRK